MEKTLPMPLQGRRNDQAGESLRDVFRRFSKSGRSWLNAEAELAQAEIAGDGKRIAMIFVMAILVMGTSLAAITLLTLFIVSLIAPYVGGLANAAGILALVLVVLSAGIAWWAWHLARAQLGVVSIAKRWVHVVTREVKSET